MANDLEIVAALARLETSVAHLREQLDEHTRREEAEQAGIGTRIAAIEQRLAGYGAGGQVVLWLGGALAAGLALVPALVQLGEWLRSSAR